MDSKLALENYLLVLKSTVEVFVHGTLESSNSNIKELLKENLNIILDCQGRTYQEMVNRGLYQVNNVECNIIKQTLDKVNNSSN